MQFNPVPTELTTAATDVVLGLLAVLCVGYLTSLRESNRWKAILWSWVFGLLAVSALLGAVVHGFAWSSATWNMLWFPLYLLLGLTVALFVVGAVYDLRGQNAARCAVPIMLAIATAFFGITRVVSGGFLIFVLYEAVAMLFALGVYGYLAVSARTPGMRLMLAGVGLNIVAAAVQAMHRISFTLVWPFDHNGVFHLIQMAALFVLLAGLRASISTATASD